MQRVNEILAHNGAELIPAEVDKRLHDQFKGLVTGNPEMHQDE
jgi:hypothetical protein